MGATLVAACGIAQGADSWADFESRIQYAYYTEDGRTLANLSALLAAREDKDPWKNYYQALANYRYAAISATPPSAREGAAEKCADASELAASSRAVSTEAAVLQSACLAMLSTLKPLRAPLAAARARKRLAEALRMAPANPRALLLEAAGQNGPDAEKTLRKALTRFENPLLSASSGPSWGAAEAWLALGHICMERGDVLGARDAIEHALLIAPDFVAARRLLVQITAGRAILFEPAPVRS